MKRICTEYTLLRDRLANDGWVTPNTYSKLFSPVTAKPAVYLFLRVTPEFDNALIAYVGMSTNLKQRLSAHEIAALIEMDGYWAMPWFKPTSASNLRKTEAKYIKAFDPPWNIIGRPRGVIH